MTPFDRILTTVFGVLNTAKNGRLANEKFLAVVAWGEERSRARDYFQDGAWHSPAQIMEKFGLNTEKIVEAMLVEGNSFQVNGMGWRMVSRENFNTPCCRGKIETIETMQPRLETTSVPFPDVVLDKVVNQAQAATMLKAPNLEGRNSVDSVQPLPPSPSVPSPIAKVTPAEVPTAMGADAIGNGSSATARVAKPEDRSVADNMQPPTQVSPTPSPVVKVTPADAPTGKTSEGIRNNSIVVAASAGKAATMPAAAVPSVVSPTRSGGAGIRQPISKPSGAPPKQSSSMPRQATKTQSAPTLLANPIRSLSVPLIGGFQWSDSQTDADLIASGVVLRYGRTYLAVDIVREERIVAQVDVDLNRSGTFLQYFGVGLARDVEHRGERALKCDRINEHCLNGRRSYVVGRDELLDVAPKIASFPTSLRLRKDRRWAMPILPGKRTGDFAIRSNWANVDCVPVIVDIDRRKTSEPVVTVQFFARHNDDQSREWEFCGEGFMSWHSAIVLAHWGRVGLKIALPEGGWTIAYLSSDVKVTPDGKEYGRSLHLKLSSLPEAARQWASSFPDIFHVPLSPGTIFPELDWTKGFPPVPKKKSS